MTKNSGVKLINKGDHPLRISGFSERLPGECKVVTSSEAEYLLGNSNVQRADDTVKDEEQPKAKKTK